MFSRIKQYIATHKKMFGLVCIVVALVLVLIINKINTKNEATRPVPTETVEASSLSFVPEPKPGEVALGGTKIGISLFFDSLIDTRSLEVEVFPPFELTPTVLADSPERVILTPTRPWQAGITYRITIKKGVTTEILGRNLADDVVLEYRVIDVPDEIEHYSPHI